MVLKLFILILGVFACSTSVIYIKFSTENPILLAAYRLFVAAIILTPFFIRDLKRHSKTLTFRILRPAVLPGITLSFHFISWIIGARMTLAAHSTLIVNMVPVMMPFFLFTLSREVVGRWEIVGTILALTGVVLLGSSDLHFSRETFNGDIICFVSMVLFALYLALARSNRNIESVWLYLVPLYYIAGLFCFSISLFFINPIKPYTLVNIIAVLGLGVVSTVIGHSILNYSMRHFRGQVVSIINLSEFIFAGIMGYFLLGEVPLIYFYISSILVVGGAFLAIRYGTN